MNQEDTKSEFKIETGLLTIRYNIKFTYFYNSILRQTLLETGMICILHPSQRLIHPQLSNPYKFKYSDITFLEHRFLLYLYILII